MLILRILRGNPFKKSASSDRWLLARSRVTSRLPFKMTAILTSTNWFPKNHMRYVTFNPSTELFSTYSYSQIASQKVLEAYDKLGVISLGHEMPKIVAIKELVDDSITYGMIRMVLAHKFRETARRVRPNATPAPQRQNSQVSPFFTSQNNARLAESSTQPANDPDYLNKRLKSSNQWCVLFSFSVVLLCVFFIMLPRNQILHIYVHACSKLNTIVSPHNIFSLYINHSRMWYAGFSTYN